MKPIALITGATSGIGAATAKLFAANNYNIIITGRREPLLQQLKDDILNGTSAEVFPLCFDVRSQEQVEEALGSLPFEWQNISLLVNNAGLASGFEPLNEGSTDDWEKMIDTNLKGLLYVTRIVSNWMIERNHGHIINIASIAGKEVYASGNVYCASKSAVLALSQGMRLDFAKYGIKVSSISPGMVETEFSIIRFHGDEKKAENVYAGFTPLYAKDIAETILFIANRPTHVNIDDVLITPTAQAYSRYVKKTI